MVSDATMKENEEERVDGDEGEWKTKQPPAGQRSVLEVTLLGKPPCSTNFISPLIHLLYWNSGFFAGTLELFLTTLGCSLAYLCLTLCLAEMTSALPFSGGLYGIVRVTMGPYLGFLMATCEMLQSIIFTSALLYPAGRETAALFGLSPSYAMLFWILFLLLPLTVNILGVKYFWRSNMVLMAVVVVLLIIYYAVSMPCMDCERNGGGVLSGQITVDKYWNILLPSASSFFSGLELLPMACRDAKEPRKTLPQAMLCSFGLIAMNALLLIITVGCNAPGSFFIAYNDTNPLYYGFSRGLHVGRRVAKMLNIPGLVVTASAFTYVYSSQLRSMGESALFPTVLRYSYGPDRVPYVALGYDIAVLLATTQPLFFFTSVVQTTTGKCVLYTPVVILGERSPYAALGFSNYLVLMTIWYLWQVRSTQKFSLHEQEIMFQAYVINANLIAKQRRRLASSAKTFKISILSPRSNEAGRWGNFAAWSLLPSCLRRLKAPRMGKNDRQPSTKVPASPITTVGLGEEQGGNFLRNSVGDMYALDEREFLKATNESSKMSEKKLFSSLSSEEIESVVKIHPAHKPSETIHVNVKHRIVVDDYGRGPAPSPSSFSSANSRGGSSSAPKKLIQSALLQANLQQQGLDHELYRLHIDGVDGEYRSSTNNTPTSSRPRSKKLSLLGQAIQEQLTHYLPSTEFMSMKDPVFEEKVEEFIFKRSRSRIMGNSGTFDIKEETTSND
eukprot:scaffold1704_cov194-Ochromonas_danica.AAC.2